MSIGMEYKILWGDIHNHNTVGLFHYTKGTLERAIPAPFCPVVSRLDSSSRPNQPLRRSLLRTTKAARWKWPRNWDEALNRISVFDRDGVFLGKWGVSGDGPGQFNRPSSIAFDGEDNLLVADSLNHRIQRYTRDGRFLHQWGGPGNDGGRFNMPWGVAMNGQDGGNGDVYVSDWRNDRIQKFSREGEFLASYGEPGAAGGPVLTGRRGWQWTDRAT